MLNNTINLNLDALTTIDLLGMIKILCLKITLFFKKLLKGENNVYFKNKFVSCL